MESHVFSTAVCYGNFLTERDSEVLYPSQKAKSEIIAFKEKTVAEILNVAPQLPGSLALQVLSRAEEFLRAQLPDASARRKLSSLLLLRVKMPGVKRHENLHEIVSLLVQIEAEGELQQFLRETDESDLLSLLSNVDAEMIPSIQNALQSVPTKCKVLIDKKLVCQLANRLSEEERLKKLWKVLLTNLDVEEWAKAAAVVLAAFTARLAGAGVSMTDLDLQLLKDARKYLENHNDAISFANGFFNYDLGISSMSPWPPRGSGMLLGELASRLPLADGKVEKLALLMKAYTLDFGQNVEVGQALKRQLHHCILHSEALDSKINGILDVEALFLQLIAEDEEDIPADVLCKLSLEEKHLEDSLTANQLMFLAEQLGKGGRCVEAARIAIVAAKLFAVDSEDEDETHDAFLRAFRWDRTNSDASEGLATAVMTLKERFSQRLEDLEERYEHLENEIKKGPFPFGMSLTWDLSGYDFSDFSRGQMQYSGTLQIFPGITAWICLCPKGDANSDPGRAALYLHVDKAAKVKVKFSAGRTELILDHDYSTTLAADGCTQGRGWLNFMEISEVQGASITLQVLSVQPARSPWRLSAPSLLNRFYGHHLNPVLPGLG